MTRANFNIDTRVWVDFRMACFQHKVKASDVLRAFVQEQVVCWTYPDTHEPTHEEAPSCPQPSR
jgi:hypothetical protein